MQDNARIHHYNKTEEWLKERGINFDYYPSYSPDLNAIKNIWSVLKTAVITKWKHLLKPGKSRAAYA